jgi:hypothetical protein
MDILNDARELIVEDWRPRPMVCKGLGRLIDLLAYAFAQHGGYLFVD